MRQPNKNTFFLPEFTDMKRTEIRKAKSRDGTVNKEFERQLVNFE